MLPIEHGDSTLESPSTGFGLLVLPNAPTGAWSQNLALDYKTKYDFQLS